MFEKVTAAAAHLEDGGSAPAEIDRVLSACLSRQQPVYLSLPSDVVRMRCQRPGPFPIPASPPSDPAVLAEAVREAAAMLEAARLPVVIADAEVIRFRLQAELETFLDRTGLPFATRMLGKAVVSEQHPQFLGLFEGDRSRPDVAARIAKADCVLQVGPLLTDFNTGGFTTELDPGRTISAGIRSVKIRHHHYEDINLRDFLQALTTRLARREPATLAFTPASAGCHHRRTAPYQPSAEAPLTIQRCFDRVSHFLPDRAIVLAETGVALFSAAETLMPD